MLKALCKKLKTYNVLYGIRCISVSMKAREK